MKKFSVLLCIVVLTVSLGGCYFGTVYVKDIDRYGENVSGIDLPDFFPDSVEGFDVNSYSFTVYSYMDVCYEVFLDINVDEKTFHRIIEDVKEYFGSYWEKEAYYAEGYYEIVYSDSYDVSNDKETEYSSNVLTAKIEKIVYNPKTYNIIFESFDAFDSGVYPLDEVMYFNRFSIDQNEYVNSIEK